MSKTVIKVPSALDLPGALGLATQLAATAQADEFLFDFSSVGVTEPFGMLLASSEIRRLRAKFEQSKFACINFERMTYAAHMGFFKAFGLNFGKEPGQARGSSSYLPLTIFHCEELKAKALEQACEVGEVVEQESKHLACMLSGDDDGAVHETLAYSLRELMRNVVEHSSAKQFGICAQHWPSKNRVEVAILDRGIGLRSSLASNPHLDVSTDKRAVNYALMPAVSGKAFKGSRTQKKGPWANSGFGLYMTSRICRNGGNFLVASGDTAMLLTKKAEGKRYFPCSLHGTAIRMVIKTDQVGGLRESLESYRRDGFEVQRRYKEIVNIDPSSASLMLSEDFDLPMLDRMLARLRFKG